MVNQTRAVDTARLMKKIGRLQPEIMDRMIGAALRLHYDLDPF
ncbi:MAG: hypothetical protein B6240_03975 [Desulfobacteraceae bacterium 4572_87]|nr:MAG: hypothetical protein B6240_03975 [Desulfobacteraceae bacterium 4572_87]